MTDTPKTLHRRAMLKRLGLAAGAIYMAPALLNLSEARASSSGGGSGGGRGGRGRGSGASGGGTRGRRTGGVRNRGSDDRVWRPRVRGGGSSGASR